MRHCFHFAGSAVAAVFTASLCVAGPMGPIATGSGMAEVVVDHPIEGVVSESAPLYFPAADNLGVSGAEGLDADLAWNIGQVGGAATHSFSASNRSAPVGESRSDLVFSFTTAIDAEYTLNGLFQGFTAEVIFDGDRTYVETDSIDGPVGNVEPDGSFERFGVLSAGEHTLTFSSRAAPVGLQSTLAMANATLSLIAIPTPGAATVLIAATGLAASRRRR